MRLPKSKRQLGASLVEYGLLVAMISVLALAGVRQTGTSLNCTFTKISGHLQGLEEQEIVCNFDNGGGPSPDPDYGNGGGPSFIPPPDPDDYDNGGGPSFIPPPDPEDYNNGGGPSFIPPPDPEEEQYSSASS